MRGGQKKTGRWIKPAAGYGERQCGSGLGRVGLLAMRHIG